MKWYQSNKQIYTENNIFIGTFDREETAKFIVELVNRYWKLCEEENEKAIQLMNQLREVGVSVFGMTSKDPFKEP